MRGKLIILVSTVQLLSVQDTGMEFGIEKCGVLIMKRGKTSSTDGIRVMDEETIKEVTEEGYKYLRILESNEVKGKETKDPFRKESFRRIRFVLNRS